MKIRQDQYRKVFEREEWFWWHRSIREMIRRLAARFNMAAQSILDVGCGSGMLARDFIDRGVDMVVALDFAKEATDLCRRRGLTRVVQGSVLDLPFPDGSFDLVTHVSLVCQFGEDLQRRALGECLRVLRPGGWMIAEVPALEILKSDHDRVAQLVERFSKGTFRRRIEAAGFRVAQCSYFLFFLFGIVAPMRIFRRWFPAGTAKSDVERSPRRLNAFLERVCLLEADFALRTGVPVGLNVFAAAQKPREEGDDGL